jgi:hypothetical protein
MIELYLSATLAVFLLIWFRTEAFVEYCRLFKLKCICYYEDYDNKKKEDARLTYLNYLLKYHNNFFTRLYTCPICVSVWVSLLFSIIVLQLYLCPVIIIGGLLLYALIDNLLD